MFAFGDKGRQLAIWCQVFAHWPPSYLWSIHCSALQHCVRYFIYFTLVDTVANRRRHIEKRFSNNNLVWCGAIASYQLRLTVTGSSTMAFGKTIQGGSNDRFGYKTKLFLTCERYHWCDSRLLCIVVMYSRKNRKHKSSNLLWHSNLLLVNRFCNRSHALYNYASKMVLRLIIISGDHTVKIILQRLFEDHTVTI